LRRRRGIVHGCDFRLQATISMPFDSRMFDAVVACPTYQRFGNKAGFASELVQVLKLSGVLYVAEPRFHWLSNAAVRLILFNIVMSMGIMIYDRKFGK